MPILWLLIFVLVCKGPVIVTPPPLMADIPEGHPTGQFNDSSVALLLGVKVLKPNGIKRRSYHPSAVHVEQRGKLFDHWLHGQCQTRPAAVDQSNCGNDIDSGGKHANFIECLETKIRRYLDTIKQGTQRGVVQMGIVYLTADPTSTGQSGKAIGSLLPRGQTDFQFNLKIGLTAKQSSSAASDVRQVRRATCRFEWNRRSSGADTTV